MPVPIRKRILKLHEQGKGTAEIASVSGYCAAAARRVRRQFKGRRTPEPQTHLQKRVAERPDATLSELGARLDRPSGPSTVDPWLRRLGLSHENCSVFEEISAFQIQISPP